MLKYWYAFPIKLIFFGRLLCAESLHFPVIKSTILGMKEFQIKTSLFSEVEIINKCNAQWPEIKNSSCFPDVLIFIALQIVLRFLHGWCRQLPVEELLLLCGAQQSPFVVQVLIFQEKIKCSSQLETPTLPVISKGFSLSHSRHVRTKPWSEKDLGLISSAICCLSL